TTTSADTTVPTEITAPVETTTTVHVTEPTIQTDTAVSGKAETDVQDSDHENIQGLMAQRALATSNATREVIIQGDPTSAIEPGGISLIRSDSRVGNFGKEPLPPSTVMERGQQGVSAPEVREISGSVDALLRVTGSADRGIVDAGVLVTTMNQAGLSIAEQKLVLGGLGGAGIVASYRESNDPNSREVGAVLARVTEGDPVTQGDLIKVLNGMGVDSRERMSHLLAFQMVQKAQRTEMFSAALGQLDALGENRENVFERVPPPGVEWEAKRPFPELTSQKVAVLIGINAYPQPVPSLGTAVNDVTAVGDKLGSLGYQSIVLKDASHGDIIGAFKSLAMQIKPGQELVVYFAGHGYYREETATGYWIPGDVDVSSAEKWISTKDISDFLSKISAAHIMVISDSCYSGSLTREYTFSADSDGLSVEEIGKRRAVMMLSSGGEEPVMDGGGDGHSVFARTLLSNLGDGNQPRRGFDLFNLIRSEVVKVAPQTPHYGAMLSAGHQVGGDYLFTGNQ
ncbi:MAG: caspase family protein, partial [Nitrospirae bacterium]|nr:caspase family protein [Magnetococcales bacterium]